MKNSNLFQTKKYFKHTTDVLHTSKRLSTHTTEIWGNKYITQAGPTIPHTKISNQTLRDQTKISTWLCRWLVCCFASLGCFLQCRRSPSCRSRTAGSAAAAEREMRTSLARSRHWAAPRCWYCRAWASCSPRGACGPRPAAVAAGPPQSRERRPRRWRRCVAPRAAGRRTERRTGRC